MTEPLKNCPFCGRAPTSIVRSDDIDGTQFLCTITCYCGRTAVALKDAQAAINLALEQQT